MDKKVIGIIVAVLVVVGGFFAYTSMSKDESNTETNTEETVNTENETATNENSGKKMSFDSFLKQGGNYRCTVNQSVENIESTGTVYVAGDRVRGEFNTSVAGMNVDTIFMVKDGFSYTWSSQMQGKGFKVAVKGDTTGSGAGSSGQYSFNASQIGDYNCEAWSVDNSKFTLPSGVVFTEINS